MDKMFYQATAFNQDISDWAVHNVEEMGQIFGWASAFNQDIGNWEVENVGVLEMFNYAVAFNQELGWCVGDDQYMDGITLSNVPCASTLCGILWGGCDLPSTGNVMANGKIRIAVAAWVSGPRECRRDDVRAYFDVGDCWRDGHVLSGFR